MDNVLDLPMPTESLTKSPEKFSKAYKCQQRRKEIASMMEIQGGYRLPVKPLAEKYGVNLSVIYDDLHIILKSIPEPVAQEISKKLNISINRALEKAHDLMNSQDKKDVAVGCRLISELVKTYIDFLERFGYKQMTMQPTVIDGRQINVNLIQAAQEEAQKTIIELKNKNQILDKNIKEADIKESD
jgi:hypothetical protein